MRCGWCYCSGRLRADGTCQRCFVDPTTEVSSDVFVDALREMLGLSTYRVAAQLVRREREAA